MYLPDVVKGAKISTCPRCDDEIRCDDSDFIKQLAFLFSLRDKADKQKSEMYRHIIINLSMCLKAALLAMNF